MGVPEGEEREQEIEKLFEEVMKETFLNLVKEIDTQSPPSRHIINKMSKVKDK